MRRLFLLYYPLTIVFVFLSSCVYEFWIEGSFSPLRGADDAMRPDETAAEQWEYVFTVTVFSAVALLFPTAMAYAIESRRRKAEEEKLRLQAQLDETLTKLLSGFVGICSVCKKVRVEDGERHGAGWHNVETYVAERTDLKFSHGYCPDCEARVRQAIKQGDGARPTRQAAGSSL